MNAAKVYLAGIHSGKLWIPARNTPARDSLHAGRSPAFIARGAGAGMTIQLGRFFLLVATPKSYPWNRNVLMERGGLFAGADIPRNFSANGMVFSERFMTTAAIRPSGFRNAVVSSSSSVEAQEMRRAPGRTNRVTCPR